MTQSVQLLEMPTRIIHPAVMSKSYFKQKHVLFRQDRTGPFA